MASHLRNITLLDPDSGMTRGVDLVTDTQGRIARIGPDLPPAPGVPVIDAQGALCLPGFVNSHNHSPLMIVRGMIEDISFAPAYTPGVPQGHWLVDEETLALDRLGVMEMLCAIPQDLWIEEDAQVMIDALSNPIDQSDLSINLLWNYPDIVDLAGRRRARHDHPLYGPYCGD